MDWSFIASAIQKTIKVYMENRVFVYREQRITQDCHKNRCSAHIFTKF